MEEAVLGGVGLGGCVGRVEEGTFCLAGLAMLGCFGRGDGGGGDGGRESALVGDSWHH